MMGYRSILADPVAFTGFNGDAGEAYYARPAGGGPFPGMVVIHHMPGWDEWTMEVARKFAHHGYAAIAPHLNFREDAASIEEAVAKMRARGGPFDDQVVGDIAGAVAFLRGRPEASGKAGIIGFCSGGRQVYLAACTLPGIDAAVDCWGGRVVYEDPADATPARPVAPVDYTAGLACPLLGLFGNEDQNPSPAQVDRIEAELKKHGKSYEFHRYDGAGHAFFAVHRPQYRVDQANDGWRKVFAFLGRTLGGPGV